MVAYAAVSYDAEGRDRKPALGSLKVEADTKVAVAERLVNFATSRSPSPTSRRCRRSRCARS